MLEPGLLALRQCGFSVEVADFSNLPTKIFFIATSPEILAILTALLGTHHLSEDLITRVYFVRDFRYVKH